MVQETLLDKFWCLIAWILPEGLVRECGWRIAAKATMGDMTKLDQVTVGEALSRWVE